MTLRSTHLRRRIEVGAASRTKAMRESRHARRGNGGAGYIGSVVTDQLIAAGHDFLLVIDNLSKGHVDAVSEAAEFAEIDLIEQDNIAAVLVEFRAEAVVHMAAASLVGEWS